MRVLVAATQGGANGIETCTRTLAASLSRRGHTALLAGRTQPGESGLSLASPNLRLRRLVGPFESQRVHRALCRVAASSQLDVIHATYPEFATRRWPTVVTAWHPATSVFGRLRMMRRRGERGVRSMALFTGDDLLAYRRARAVVAVTQEVQRALGRVGVTAHWIPPFIEDDEIAETTAERELTCVMVARYLDDPRKGLATAIEAVEGARRLRPGLRLVLAGGWRDPRAADQLPGFCVQAGILDAAGVRAALRGAGCCLVPSHWEEFGYAGIEALAAGAPLVVSPLPAFDGMVVEGLFSTDPADPAAWASAILQALSVEQVEFPGVFRASVGIPRLLDIYERVAGPAGTTPPRSTGRATGQRRRSG